MADPELLRQVLVNLFLNSLDALPHGGIIHAAVESSDQHVQIRISDSGAGIATDMMPRLFQPFSSNKDTGLGLGLVITKRIVEDHGGTITAENQTSGGASFLVMLPKDEPAVH
jgi:signal transduction histidine kinase